MISRKKSSTAKEKEDENSASFSDTNAWYSDYPLTSKPYKKRFFRLFGGWSRTLAKS